MAFGRIIQYCAQTTSSSNPLEYENNLDVIGLSTDQIPPRTIMSEDLYRYVISHELIMFFEFFFFLLELSFINSL